MDKGNITINLPYMLVPQEKIDEAEARIRKTGVTPFLFGNDKNCVSWEGLEEIANALLDLVARPCKIGKSAPEED